MSSDSAMPRRLLKDAVLRALSLPWEAGFGTLGVVLPRAPRRIDSPGGLRLLVVAPHPDDEVAGCAGTICLHRERGDRVTVAHVTDGSASRALGLGPDEMARTRRAESERAARILDVEPEWLDLPEGRWVEADLEVRLRDLLDRLAPDVVYAPSRVDFHPEHGRVAGVLATALAGARSGATVRVYEVQTPLTSALVNRVAETGAWAARTREATLAYASQLGSLRRTLRTRRYAALRHRAGALAEVFWELPADRYAALHRHAGPDPGESMPFRGVRRLPFGDPLAYLLGRAERRRLRVAGKGR